MHLLFLLIFLFVPQRVYASGEFHVQQNSLYQFQNNGTAQVTHTITLTNKFPTIYAKEYNLTISNPDLENIQAYDENGNILVQSPHTQTETPIKLVFTKPAVGKNQTKTFTISYKQKNLAYLKGSLWQITLPQIKNDYLDLNTSNVKTPISWGDLAYSSQKPNNTQTTNGYHETVFISAFSLVNKISLSYGQAQLLNFNLVYYLSNTSPESITQNIAIPADNQLQRLNYQTLNPKPKQITYDDSGNWLATYSLNPKQNLKVEVTGQAKIFQNITYPKLATLQAKHSLNASQAWPIDKPRITQINSNLRNAKDIYNYVVSTLTYDYSRLNNAKKLGVEYILENPNQALCTEFTDLFITLARAKGIASREVIGYALSNNPESKPLNKNTDILHAWPQYYDPITQVWKDIDPTWGKTTGGVDYFSALDLNHLAFVTHSTDDKNPPPPGSYRNLIQEKTVTVDYAQDMQELGMFRPIISLKKVGLNGVTLKVENPNLHAIYNLSINQQVLPLVAPLQTLEIVLPYHVNLNPKLPLIISYEDQTYQTQILLPIISYIQIALAGFAVLFLLFLAIIITRRK